MAPEHARALRRLYEDRATADHALVDVAAEGGRRGHRRRDGDRRGVRPLAGGPPAPDAGA